VLVWELHGDDAELGIAEGEKGDSLGHLLLGSGTKGNAKDMQQRDRDADEDTLNRPGAFGACLHA